MDGRPMARLIDNKVKSPLSRRVLFGDLVDGGRVTIEIVNDDLDFTVTEIPKPLTKEEKKALKALKLADKENEKSESQTDQ